MNTGINYEVSDEAFEEQHLLWERGAPVDAEFGFLTYTRKKLYKTLKERKT